MNTKYEVFSDIFNAGQSEFHSQIPKLFVNDTSCSILTFPFEFFFYLKAIPYISDYLRAVYLGS